MSETSKNPLTMVGSEDAAVCVDGVCEVSPVQESAPGSAGAEQAPTKVITRA